MLTADSTQRDDAPAQIFAHACVCRSSMSEKNAKQGGLHEYEAKQDCGAVVAMIGLRRIWQAE